MSTSYFPFFSVVIPSYNRLAFVVKAVQSVLEQTYQDVEIIVVDDGSTDRTFEELNEKFRSENRLRIIRQENSERGAARNRGFRESLGTYVIFLDSDDYFVPEHLATLANKIKQLGKPDFITTKYELLRDGRLMQSSISNLPEGFYDYHLFLRGNPIAANVCVRKNAEHLILFEEDRRYAIYEDWFFFLENLHSKKIYIIDQVTVHMHDHDERSMRSDHQLIIGKAIAALEWIRKKKLLDKKEEEIAAAHLSYLCAIHSYVDGRRIQSWRFILQSIRSGGLHLKHLVLAAKIIPGPALMSSLKKKFQAG